MEKIDSENVCLHIESAGVSDEPRQTPSSTSVTEDALSALRFIQDPRKLEAEIRNIVKSLLTEKGEAHIQSMLQAEIQRVKKKESELAAIKKKVNAVSREIDDVRAEVHRSTEAKKEAEHSCKVLQVAMKRREDLTIEAKREMEEHRRGVQEKVEKSVSDIREKCNERKKIADETMEENRRLREEVAQRKKEFDEAYTMYQDNWKEREVHAKDLLKSFQEISKEVELLEARLALARRECAVSVEGKRVLQKQLETYGAQFRDFGEGHSMEDVEALATQQREQGAAKIAQLESEKKEANELRLKFDKEATDLRAAHAAAKKELQKVERARISAEKKCRQAQEKVRQLQLVKEKTV